MANSDATSTLTKKYPRSILSNRNSNQSRTDRTNENVIQSNYLNEPSYQLNVPTIVNNVYSATVDNYNSQQLVQSTTNCMNPTQLEPALSNQPIYESQLTYNPVTGQHEQQLITCEQYYNSMNKAQSRTEYSGCLASFLNYDFQLSIDSWKRRLLISILIINAIMAITNATIIIWIVSYYYLSINEIIDFNSNEITLRGDAHFERSVQLNSLSSIENEQLRIRSNNIIAQDARTEAELCLDKNGRIVGDADTFVLNDKDGQNKMVIGKNNFLLSINKVSINNDRQLNLGKSIQTKQLTSKSNLNIISLNRKIVLESSGLINLQSKTDLNLTNNSTDNLNIGTRTGRIALNTSSIEILNLQSYLPSKTGTSYPDIYQLCICPNSGKLFVDTADGHCITEHSVCQST